MKSTTSQSAFTRFAKWTSRSWPAQDLRDCRAHHFDLGGSRAAIFKFSDTWQLVINTSTTIITFLMVFLIQNTQNRDSEADSA